MIQRTLKWHRAFLEFIYDPLHKCKANRKFSASLIPLKKNLKSADTRLSQSNPDQWFYVAFVYSNSTYQII